MRTLTITVLICLWGACSAAAPCGGPFAQFVDNMRAEASATGIDQGTIDAFFENVRQDNRTLAADRRQSVFQLPFIEFSRRLISQNRIDRGRQMERRWSSTFAQISDEYGIPPGVLLAFWAFETDYGAFQGDFNTVNSLMTLGHDCRRPEIFQPQIIAALELFAKGMLDPATTTGAWAGEIGMVQMLPRDILLHGRDGDGDGVLQIKRSAPDALVSGADMLQGLGWRANEPWLHEVTVPSDFDWSRTGSGKPRSTQEWIAMGVRARSDALAQNLTASLILPQGRFGPAFLTYPNFDVYLLWNNSFTYALTAAYFGTRLQGAPVYNAGSAEPGLSGEEIKQLQTRLQARGFDVGGVDGILGAKSRVAVQQIQEELNMPADAWPTRALLDAMQ